ncbi:MAG: CapA family protein [Oscillospiraceae bacterium]|jgi:poly-gamma-glutamate synthesis protein (capsule biosynthesis protein)|nr:CapA family protein [Oscillospiraceae bacterium]
MKRIITAAAVVAAAIIMVVLAVSSPPRLPDGSAQPPTPAEPSGAPAFAESPEPSPAPPPSPSPEPSPEPTPEPPSYSAVIAVGGDVLPTGNIGKKIAAGLYADILDETTAARFREADIALINLETSVSERGTPIPGKAYTFRSEPENLSFLTDWLGVDCVSLANNHTPDWGWDAFDDTLTYLDEYGIARIGAGRDLADAAAPYIAEVNGLKIAIFAANQVNSYSDWPATDKKAGQLISRDAKKLGILGENIAKVRGEVDYIIAFFHWGIELDTTPSSMQTSMAHALIDAGVDVVLGAHPHVVQSFEYYKGKPIAYSVGNFLFNARNPETCVLYIHIDGAEVNIEIVPMNIKSTLTSIAAGDAGAAKLAKWSAISIGAVISEDGMLFPAEE